MGKKFYIETFGCQMNVLDSEQAAALLRRMGYEPTADLREADIVLLNTCMVREKPEEKVYVRVRQIRRERKDVVLGIMGCVAQARGRTLIERLAGIQFVVGTQRLSRLPDLVQEAMGTSEPDVDVRTENIADFVEIAPAERQRRHTAFVTIMEGCDKFCSFCVVPFTRGRERSRSPIKILSEVKALREAGYQEVCLLGQNVNSYGLSRRVEQGPVMSFAELLRLVAEESGVPRIKFTTSHPKDFTPEIVRAIEDYPNLCNWVHLPPQSGSDRVLTMMNRGYRRSDYLRKVELIYSAKRDISLTGDIIVGFPGETDRDFEETVRLIEEVAFDGLYIFKYSPRPYTPAARWGDQIPDDVKTERVGVLVEKQREIQMRKHQKYIGKCVEVLVEGRSAKSDLHWSGYSTSNLVVNFESSVELSEGLIVQVQITRINPHSLFGRFVKKLYREGRDHDGT
jgi:tRNA-2-methylthio-N6-dimethylallyladenosine synthase